MKGRGVGTIIDHPRADEGIRPYKSIYGAVLSND